MVAKLRLFNNSFENLVLEPMLGMNCVNFNFSNMTQMWYTWWESYIETIWTN